MIYLDDAFFSHPKVIAAGGEATLLYLKGLSWLKQQGSTDGRIPKIVLPVIAPDLKGKPVTGRTLAGLADRLVDVGMWDEDSPSHWTCHGYVERNEKAIAKSQQARAAARQRHAKTAPQTERTQSGRRSGTAADAPAEPVRTQNDESCVRNAVSVSQPTETDTAHSPQPTATSSSSSSNGSTTAADHVGEEEEDPRIRRACDLLAKAALEQRTGPPVTNRRSWLTRVADERWADHADHAAQILDGAPDLTAEQLAHILEPPPDDFDEQAHLDTFRVTPEELELRRKAAEAEAFQASPEGAAARDKVRDIARALRGEETDTP